VRRRKARRVTAKQQEALEILRESPRGSSTTGEVAYLLGTTNAGAGRVLSGLMAQGLATRSLIEREAEWWPIDVVAPYQRASRARTLLATEQDLRAATREAARTER
jgi:hypothetical protein